MILNKLFFKLKKIFIFLNYCSFWKKIYFIKQKKSKKKVKKTEYG
jgi:hypothetical protein